LTKKRLFALEIKILQITLKKEIKMKTREQVIEILNGLKSNAQYNVEKFKKDFEENPSHALIWSQNVFEAQSRFEVCTYLLNAIERCELSIFYKHLTKEVLQRAQYRNGSTSATSNLFEEFKTMAYATILEKITL
jgi:hypothetical protein